MSEKKKLFSQFPPVSTEEWMDKVRVDLKGADFDKKLVWKSKEGINVNPFYRDEDINDLPHIKSLPGEFPFVRGREKYSNSWYVRQNIVVKELPTANKKALEILNRGVNSLGFVFDADTKYDLSFMESLLEGIYIESIEINFYPAGGAMELLKSFKELVSKRGIKPSLVKGAIEADPLGRYMINGKLCIPVEDGIDYLKGMMEGIVDFPEFKVVRINGANFSNAGSSIVQKLAMSVAMGNEYITQLSQKDIDPGLIARSIGFTFGIGSNYFFEIAGLRAARMLWSIIVKKYGVNDAKAQIMNIHATTSEWNKTAYDPYVNMLRTQTEAMSATLGGADSLSVNPFDSIFGESADMGERVARNQQLLLKEEAHFDKIVDPGAGSYYIEKLTSSIANKAWDLFIEIEEKGGFLECLRTGFIQDRVEQNASRRNLNVARGREKFLGTNIFANPGEQVKDLPPKIDEDKIDIEVRPLKIYRGAELFEKLRFATDSAVKRPKVFMLTIGNLVMRKARAQFSSNFFSVAGYEIIDNIGFDSCSEGIEAALKSEAEIVVLCSSDDEYKSYAPEIYEGLKRSSEFVIAGAPECENELREKGIEHFISMRSDLLDTLQSFNDLLGIK